MADISSMEEGPTKKKLLKRMKLSQRQQLGIPQSTPIFKVSLYFLLKFFIYIILSSDVKLI